MTIRRRNQQSIARTRSSCGTSLIEIQVAALLAALIGGPHRRPVGLGHGHHRLALSSVLASVVGHRRERTARIIADARESTATLCSGSETLVLNVAHGNGNGSVYQVTECCVVDGPLVRWRTSPDKEFILMDCSEPRLHRPR